MTMTPTRDQFLKECWSHYPPFPADEGWIGGALVRSDGAALPDSASTPFSLLSNGLTIPLHLEKTQFDSDLRRACVFLPELLRAGDLVAIRLHGGTVERLRLLVAAPELSETSMENDVTPGNHHAKRSPGFTSKQAHAWADFIDRTRSFFKERGFTEALTPTLVPSPGTEPYLDAFKTEWAFGSERKTMFLPTSPEFHLKKMIAQGHEKIFEIKTCFRNGEVGDHHQPEFQMLEWYRAFATLDAIANDVKDLLKPHAVREVSVAQLFHQYLRFELTPQTTREELEELCLKNGILTADDDAWDDLFFRLFLEKIEHRIDPNIPYIVRYYPPSQAALSRILPNGWADRFEVYWKGLEIANAFHELNDPKENIARFKKDNEDKVRTGREPVPIDHELIDAIQNGMPPSGGIALGLDRLFMALTGEKLIARTRAFPFGVSRRD